MSTEHISVDSPSLSVRITLNNTTVQAITFTGTKATDPVLNEYIRHCLGYSLRECAEHSAMYVVHDSQKYQKRKPQHGIDCIHMVGSTLELAQSLLRQALKQYSTNLKDWNFEDRGLTIQWQKKSQEQQRQTLGNIASQYLERVGYSKEALSLVQIDQYGRLFYEFSQDVPIAAKPGLLLGLEQEFQNVLQERLEVFLTEMKDQHKLRRL